MAVHDILVFQWIPVIITRAIGIGLCLEHLSLFRHAPEEFWISIRPGFTEQTTLDAIQQELPGFCKQNGAR